MPKQASEGGDALIHLRVPATTKAAWVRESRAAGMRLTDYITQAVEAHMAQQRAVRIQIPDDVSFSDLRLARGPDGDVSLDWAPIERICEASGLDITLFRDSPEDNLGGLIMHWYQEHRAGGGGADPVAEDLIAEARAEDAAGQRASLPPGRA